MYILCIFFLYWVNLLALLGATNRAVHSGEVLNGPFPTDDCRQFVIRREDKGMLKSPQPHERAPPPPINKKKPDV